jgi:hypothetical protein
VSGDDVAGGPLARHGVLYLRGDTAAGQPPRPRVLWHGVYGAPRRRNTHTPDGRIHWCPRGMEGTDGAGHVRPVSRGRGAIAAIVPRSWSQPHSSPCGQPSNEHARSQGHRMPYTSPYCHNRLAPQAATHQPTAGWLIPVRGCTSPVGWSRRTRRTPVWRCGKHKK